MNHRTGLDRSQTLLFPERLEDYITAENPGRFLDAFVGSLDLHPLGFARGICAPPGRPPFHPRARAGASVVPLLFGLSVWVVSLRPAGSGMPAQRGSALAAGQTRPRLQDH